MKICFWSTTFQADNQTLACYLANEPGFEVLAAIDEPAAYRREPGAALLPFRGELIDRKGWFAERTIRRFQPDVVVVDNHLPEARLAPRVFVLWHGFGWRMDDISGMRRQLSKLVGDVTVPNDQFRWQAFGDWDRDFTVSHRRIAAENVLALGSAYSDVLLPGSALQRSFDRRTVADAYPFDVASGKTVLLGMTWHHGNLLGHWGDEPALMDTLFSHLRSRGANVIFRLHDRARYSPQYIKELGRLTQQHTNVHVKFKSENPDSLADLLVSDVMISNYSSFANAFYYTGKPCIHIDPVDASATELVWRRFRGGQVSEEPVEGLDAIWKLRPDVHGGLRASSFDQLLAQVDQALADPSCCEAASRSFVDQYIHGADGTTCRRIADVLQAW
jgi:hypothetical protein